MESKKIINALADYMENHDYNLLCTTDKNGQRFFITIREVVKLLDKQEKLINELKNENKKFKDFMQQNDWESVEEMETTLDKCGEALYKKMQREYKRGYKQGKEKTKNDIFKKLFESNGNTRADIWYLDLVEIAKQFGFNEENY